jgi:PEP-CTERM motif
MRLLTVVLFLCLPVLPAAAATMQSVYAGTVLFSTDTAGIFGGGSQDGMVFSLTTTYDTAHGQTVAGPSGTTQLRGGTATGFSDPYLSASLTINGQSYSFGPARLASVSVDGFGSSFRQSVDLSSFDPITGISRTIMFGTLLADQIGMFPTGFSTPFTWTRGAFGVSFGSGDYNISAYDTVNRKVLFNTIGYLRIDNVAVTQLTPAPVPLPASALMLLAGLGAMAAARRRRVKRV